MRHTAPRGDNSAEMIWPLKIKLRGNGIFVLTIELLGKVLNDFKNTLSWSKRGGYSFRKLSKKMLKVLEPYKVDQVQLAERH